MTDAEPVDNAERIAVEQFTAHDALHHAVDPAHAAAEIALVTAPDGRIVIVDFAAGDDHEAAHAGHAEQPDHGLHVHDLTAEQLPALFEPHGLRVAATDTYRLEADADAGIRFRDPIVSFRLAPSA